MPSTVAARPVRRAAEETDPRLVDAVLAAAMAVVVAAESDRTRSAVVAGAVLVSVAAEAVGHDDEAAARALEQIRSAASATLRELRSTVKLLRSPGADPAERSSIGLAGIPQLITAAQDAGVEVTARIDVDPHELDTTIDAAAHRIAQESLTNVLRHSGARHAAGEALLSPSVTRTVLGSIAARPATVLDDAPLRALSDREREVLEQVGRGLSNDEIAQALFLSPATARTYVSRLLAKLGARDRSQLVVLAYETGLITPGR